jgi:uncharacterized protein DUF1579
MSLHHLSNWTRSYGLLTLALLLSTPNFASPQTNGTKAIFEHMDHLCPLVGTWDADYEFHKKDGTMDIVEPGKFNVSWVLDNTYLQIETEHHRPEDPTRHWTYFTFITYDPATKKYLCTFFYGRWSQRVTEDGLFDERSKELRTIGLVPLEDGKRDEQVPNIYRLTGTDAPTVIHYSRYSDETSERMDLVIKLRRHEQAAIKSSTQSLQ